MNSERGARGQKLSRGGFSYEKRRDVIPAQAGIQEESPQATA